jgi:hypothetical protein
MEVRNWILDFDMYDPVDPISFDLDVPAWSQEEDEWREAA